MPYALDQGVGLEIYGDIGAVWGSISQKMAKFGPEGRRAYLAVGANLLTGHLVKRA